MLEKSVAYYRIRLAQLLDQDEKLVSMEWKRLFGSHTIGTFIPFLSKIISIELFGCPTYLIVVLLQKILLRSIHIYFRVVEVLEGG
jgi:hypothetical protein